MSKRILILYQDWNNWFTNDYSKFEYWFKKLDQAYDEDNEYLIISFGNLNKEFFPEKNVKVKLIKSNPIKQFIDLFKLKSEIENQINLFKPTTIYSSFIYLLSIVPKSINYKIFGFVRDKTAEMVKGSGGYRKLVGNIFYFLDYLAFKKIDTIFHNGKSMRKYAKNIGFKGESFYCPRPIADFNSDFKFNYRKNLNLGNKKIILSINRLTREKNLILGIETMKFMPENFHYLIVGEGLQKKEILGKIKKLNLSDRITVLDYVEHKKVHQLYQNADIFWLLSKSDFEGTPNVLQEAYYNKLPCIVSKVTAMKNIVENNVDSLILKTWNSKELAEKTINLLNDKNKYLSMQKMQKVKINYILKQNKKIEVFFK